MLQIYRYKYTTYPYIIASKYKSYNNIIYIIMFIYYISLYIIYCSGTLCYISLDAITSYLYVESWQVIFFYTRWIELGWQANWNWWHVWCFVVFDRRLKNYNLCKENISFYDRRITCTNILINIQYINIYIYINISI